MEKDFENLKEYVLLLEERLSTLEKKQKETKKPTKQASTKKSIPKQPDIQEFKYMDVYEVYPDKVSVVFNGMDTDVFTKVDIPREKDTLLFVGNTEDHKKGIVYLLQALKMLPDHVKLTIVDEGPPLKLTATNLVKSIGVEDRVEFTGKVSIDELVRLYSSKSILVMSSLHEGFGLPAAEAMSCETPVVVTTSGALKEVVTPDCGILVPPRDPEAMKNAIQKLLKDDNLRKEMGQNGRKRAVDNFSWPVAAKNTLEVYKDVIKDYRRMLERKNSLK